MSDDENGLLVAMAVAVMGTYPADASPQNPTATIDKCVKFLTEFNARRMRGEFTALLAALKTPTPGI